MEKRSKDNIVSCIYTVPIPPLKLNQTLNILFPTARDGGCGLAGKFIYGCCWVEGEAGDLIGHTHIHIFPKWFSYMSILAQVLGPDSFAFLASSEPTLVSMSTSQGADLVVPLVRWPYNLTFR